MSDQAAYEYTAVKLPISMHAKHAEENHTDLLNRVAAHGWRLVSVVVQHTDLMAYFERPASKQ